MKQAFGLIVDVEGVVTGHCTPQQECVDESANQVSSLYTKAQYDEKVQLLEEMALWTDANREERGKLPFQKPSSKHYRLFKVRTISLQNFQFYLRFL